MIQGISVAAQTHRRSARWREHQQELADAILKDPDVVSLTSFIGVDGTNMTLNSGRFLINLKPQDERTLNATADRPPHRSRRRPSVAGVIALPAAGAGPDDRCRDQPHAVPVRAGEPQRQRRSRPGCRSCWQRLQQSPEPGRRRQRPAQQGLTVNLVIDRATAARFGITPATVDNALYDAFGQRIISTIFTQSNQYRVILEADPALQQSLASAQFDLPAVIGGGERARCRCRRSCMSSRSPGRWRSAISASSRPPRSRSTCAGRLARRGGRGRSARRRQDIGLPDSFVTAFQGAAAALRGVAVERAAADPGGDRHRLHRARRAVRELHPSDHDPLDAAVGRRRRAAGADDRRRRPRRDRRSSASSC